VTVICSGSIPPRLSVWTKERILAFERLVEQCRPNLCSTIMATDLGINGGNRERIVDNRLKLLRMKGQSI
jgi:hypothetical protein